MTSDMKRLFIVMAFLFVVFSLWAQEAQKGIRFLEGEKWEKVLELATREGKCIFMDCYTSWCGPCKALAKDVFTRRDVGDFFNANFINVKYDMEKGEGKALRKRYQEHIIGYPTLLLLDKEGNVLHRMAGFQEGEVLIAGMKAGKEGESLFALRARYRKGERDLPFLKKYMQALNGAFLKDDMVQVVQDYMEHIPLDSLKNKEVWDFVWTYIKDPYSPQFAYVLDNINHFRYRMKVDMYALESQFVYALGRAVRECTALKKDEKGRIAGLADEPEKVKVIRELLRKADLKQRTEMRIKLYIHDLELQGAWEKVLDYLQMGREIGVLEHADSFRDDVYRYMALTCRNRGLLEQVLAEVEDLQRQSDQSTAKHKMAYYDTLSMLYDVLGDTAKTEENREKADKREKALRKEFEAMMKQ